MKTKMLVGLGVSAFALALAAKEAVVMTVNGEDVPKSEFEYLYHKNSQQQMTTQPIEEYVNSFKLFKLKVAEARAEGLDTLPEFVKEMEQYRHDLASPYLADSTYMYKLLDESVDRAKSEVEARHIMLFKSRDASENKAKRQKIDSLRNVLMNGGNFEELATKYSEDRRSSLKGGDMGYITALQYPYTFETAAYNLPEGKISEVVESPAGYHILKGGKRRPASGEVLASHILIMTQGDADKEAKAKVLADSLYKVVSANPDEFADVARRFSEDPGSARAGGKLDWFGRGRMVHEFDSVAFAIPDGTVSEPFKTRFGYHIIYRQDHKGAPSAQDLKPRFLSIVSSNMDPRSKMIRDNQSEKLAKKLKGKLNKTVVDDLRSKVAVNGIDSVFYAETSNDSRTIAQIGNKNYPVKDFIKSLGGRLSPDMKSSLNIFDDLVDIYFNDILIGAEEDRLLASKPEYSNLYNEYVNGSLLYEVSVRKVWDKASKDEDGLKHYFEVNKDKYVWEEPRAKGYLVQASNDSVAELVKKRAMVLGRDSLVNTIRKEFPKEVSISKVLETKGNNAMIDHLLFGGPEATPGSGKFTEYFMIDPRVIIVPEEMQDVRGLVTADYQNALQKEWEDELVKKYPVT
ncbi:MAG: peptidyl-prolyl cis-trans isomerase, partial [Muribaculaceae bacterium]|nr:peptidyl-prolyl cis-trans isomerase [Muribaculaceae bacterium]